jgi:hypothetical protein
VGLAVNPGVAGGCVGCAVGHPHPPTTTITNATMAARSCIGQILRHRSNRPTEALNRGPAYPSSQPTKLGKFQRGRP